MTVVNFSHPLTEAQRTQVESLAGRAIDRVIDVPTHFADDRPFADQAGGLVAAAGLTDQEWQTLPLLVNLPGFAPVAAVILAHLHGLMGHFPTVVRLRPARGSAPAAFEVAEVIGLQAVRDRVRAARAGTPREDP